MYRIDWTPSSLDDLASGWETADPSLREEITRASHELENTLKHAPDVAGESRGQGARLLFIHPLWATFHVNVRLKVVLVSAVQVFRRK